MCEAEKNTSKLVKRARRLIREYCFREFGDMEVDFSDITKILIAYATATDEELPVEVFADLKACQMRQFVDGRLYNVDQYNDLEEMIDVALEHLDFDDLVSLDQRCLYDDLE